MKYHNRMGEGWQEAKNYKHDSLVIHVMSTTDFCNSLLDDNGH